MICGICRLYVMSTLYLHDFGRAAYGPVLDLQMAVLQRVLAGHSLPRAWLLLVEHDPPVITLGRRGRESDFQISREALLGRGFEIHEASRGGEVTTHGPGQLVGYPIIQLDRDGGQTVRGYVRNLEETVIQLLGKFGISAGRVKGFTGVWVGDEKVAAIGVAVRRWTTYHGFALNVCNDLSAYDLFVPCGITDKGVTSLSKLLGRAVSVEEIKPLLIECFADVFSFDKIIRENPKSKIKNPK